ncbi:MAG: SUF system Fe-S cluster assembly protein [Flavobacteriales bacterium]
MDKKELEKLIIEALKSIYDPEIPVDIYELGLIYNIDIADDSKVKITMTLTTPNCPVAESLPVDIELKIGSLKDVKSVEINLTFEPPWHKDMMSEEAKFELGFL